MNRILPIVTLALCLVNFLYAEQAAPATSSVTETSEAIFERRIAGRATTLLAKLELGEPVLEDKVRGVVLDFYRQLSRAHTTRDEKLRGLSTVDPEQIHRIHFDADKQSQHIYGNFIGTLAPLISEKQVEAIKDWMTFDIVRLSVEEHERMFPAMTSRQKEQIYLWLIASREVAVIAGSAETKLDVFRVNKMRMHAYLAAQGFEVETAVSAEAARKAALKKSGS